MYSLYLVLSIALTVWVAKTLFTNGQVFLLEVFDGEQGLATSVNHLLVVGFYLINLGFVSLTLKTTAEVPDARACIETLASKVGLVLLTLGGMHFFNLLVFNKIRHRGATQYTNLPGGFVAGRHHM